MTYSITAYSRAAARRLGVTIVSSTRKNKKIDVISKQTKKKLASIGDSRYSDFPSYVSSHGMAYTVCEEATGALSQAPWVLCCRHNRILCIEDIVVVSYFFLNANDLNTPYTLFIFTLYHCSLKKLHPCHFLLLSQATRKASSRCSNGFGLGPSSLWCGRPPRRLGSYTCACASLDLLGTKFGHMRGS